MSKGRPFRTWVISDTHFNHKALTVLEGRPSDFNEEIIRNWQQRVHPDDLVIHLGDVVVGRASELPGIMAQLPGRKVLVLGNHDNNPPGWYMKRGFDFVCHKFEWGEYYDFGRVIFSHMPIIPHREFAYNVHGHLHRADRLDRLPDEGRGMLTQRYLMNKHMYVLFPIEEELGPIQLYELLGAHREWSAQSSRSS